MIDVEWKEEVTEVKKGIFEFFKEHFSSSNNRRPKIRSDYVRRKLQMVENGDAYKSLYGRKGRRGY